MRSVPPCKGSPWCGCGRSRKFSGLGSAPDGSVTTGSRAARSWVRRRGGEVVDRMGWVKTVGGWGSTPSSGKQWWYRLTASTRVVGGFEEVLSAQLHWDTWGIGGGWAFVGGRTTEGAREGAGRRGLGAGWEEWWWVVVVVVSVCFSDCFEVAIALLFT
jgi:hypothetical protein